MNPSPIKMSVIICTYNGEAVIERAIVSLLEQRYPKNRYEIIVVDDGSTDSTAQIVKRYPVSYIRHRTNQGIAAARNTGLAAMRGKVYVGFDDDCIASPDWLRELDRGYRLPGAIAIAGRIVDSSARHNLADRYMAATGAGNAPVVTRKPSSRVLGRLVAYVRCRLASPHPPVAPSPVAELTGANASFLRTSLQVVGGWDVAASLHRIGGVEDTDLSRRLRNAFPDKKFYVVPTAEITHEPDLQLWPYLRRQYRRGPAILNYYRRNQLTPPLFPFPFMVALGVVAAAIWQPLAALSVALLLPQAVYFWWPVRAVRQRSAWPFVYSYIELAEETMAVAGLVRGYRLLASAYVRASASRYARALPAVMVALLGYLALGDRFPPGPAKVILASSFLLLIPGYLLLRLITPRQVRTAGPETWAFSAGLSVIILMILGLGVNTLLQRYGIAQPLSAQYLRPVIGVFTGLLAALLIFTRKHFVPGIRRLRLTLAQSVLVVLSTLVPIIAAAGAITLNNGGPAGLALVALGIIIVIATTLSWAQSDGFKRLQPYALFTIALGLLLATSLRGWNITGHDIIQEYQVFQLTNQHGVWRMSFFQDAYNACLSITIVPTILAKLTRVSDPYVYKLLFPFVAAIVPVALYGLLSRFVGRQLAFVSAIVFVTFPTFFTDMAMLNRQEIALLCFILLFSALFEQRWSRPVRYTLILLTGIGMIFSHYSTSYVALSIILAAKFIEIGARVLMAILRRPRPKKSWMPLSWLAIASLLVALVTWNSFITHTSSGITKTIRGIVTSIPQVLNGNAKAGEASYSVLSKSASAEEIFANYTASGTVGREFPTGNYYPPAITAAYPVAQTHDAAQPVNRFGRFLHVSQSLLTITYDKLRFGYAAFVQVFIVLGILAYAWLMLARRLPRQYYYLGIGSLMMIGLQVALPSSVIDYGLLRLIQQSLVFLAIPLVLACTTLLRLIRIPERYRLGLVATLFMAFFAVLSGLIPAVTGGYKASLTTANQGFYYQAYYTHSDELAGFAWLQTHVPTGAIVNADDFARRKMITYAGIYARPQILPDGISVGSYVYLSHGNLEFDSEPKYFNGNLIFQKPPLQFLSDQKNLVYNAGFVKVYK